MPSFKLFLFLLAAAAKRALKVRGQRSGPPGPCGKAAVSPHLGGDRRCHARPAAQGCLRQWAGGSCTTSAPGTDPVRARGPPGPMLCWILVRERCCCWCYGIRSSKSSVNARTARAKLKSCQSVLLVPTLCHQQSSGRGATAPSQHQHGLQCLGLFSPISDEIYRLGANHPTVRLSRCSVLLNSFTPPHGALVLMVNTFYFFYHIYLSTPPAVSRARRVGRRSCAL